MNYTLYRDGTEKPCELVQETEHHITVEFENGIKDTVQKWEIENGKARLVNKEGEELRDKKVEKHQIVNELIKIGFGEDGNMKQMPKAARKVAEALGVSHNTIITCYHNHELYNDIEKYWLGKVQPKYCRYCGGEVQGRKKYCDEICRTKYWSKEQARQKTESRKNKKRDEKMATLIKKGKEIPCEIIQETDHHVTIKYDNGIKDTISWWELENGDTKLIDMEGNQVGKKEVGLNQIVEELIKLGFGKDGDKIGDYSNTVANELGVIPTTIVTYYHQHKLYEQIEEYWQKQREENQMEEKEEPQKKEKRCKHCNSIIKNGQPHKKYCTDQCRMDYWNFKAAEKKASEAKKEPKEVKEEVPQVQEETPVEYKITPNWDEDNDEFDDNEMWIKKGTIWTIDNARTLKVDENESMLIPGSFTGRVTGLRYEIDQEGIVLGDIEGTFFLKYSKEETEALIRELQEVKELCS